MLLESQLKRYLDGEAAMLSQMLDAENDQLKFARWKSEVAKPIKVVSYKTLPIAEDIDDKIKSKVIKVKTKECYDNSFWTAYSAGSGIKYCEGIASRYIPLDHAWNSSNGKYFDLTAEVALGDYYKKNNIEGDPTFDEYILLIELTSSEIRSFASELGHSGPYALAYFYKNVLKKWDKKIIRSLKTVF